MRYFVLVLFAFALASIFAVSAGAQTTTTTGSSFASTFCSGTTAGAGATAGIIPANTILSGKTTGENSIILYSFLIMLTMLLITALIFMVGYIMNLPTLLNLAKDEIGEVFITAIIIIILVGGFSATATSITGFSASGTGNVRQVYVDDCTYLTQTSISLIAPIFALNLVDLFSQTAQSTTIVFEPDWFGIKFQPLAGFGLFDSVFGMLSAASVGMVGLVFVVLFFLAFVYGLFPLFLYAGIVLRTVPWTRPAGGAFLGLYMGFYILFPLMLHFLLSGYITCMNTSTCYTAPTINPSSASLTTLVSQGQTQASASPQASGFFTYLLNFIEGVALGNGLIPSYIVGVLEPAGFTIFAAVISFMLAIDFTELAGDLLGAPSLTGGQILNRLL